MFEKYNLPKLGIRGKIAVSFAAMSLIIVIVGLTILVTTNLFILNDYFSGEMLKRIEHQKDAADITFGELREYLSFVNDKDINLKLAVEAGDSYSINVELASYKKGFGLHSYVLTTLDGEILATDVEGYDDVDKKATTDLAKYIVSHGPAVGAELILEKDLSFYAASILTNADGGDIGVLIFTKYAIASDEFLDAQSSNMGMEMSAINGNVIKNTTLVNADGEKLSGTIIDNQEILDCLYKLRQPYTKNVTYNGVNYFSYYAPRTNYKGDVIGAIWYGLDSSIRTRLNIAISNIMFWSLLAIGAVLTFIFVFIINKSVVRPIIKLSDLSKKIAKGNLKVDVYAEKYIDEVGELQESMYEMVSSMSSVVTPIVHMAQQLSTASDQLSKSSQMLSDGASRQAASLEEVSSSMEEIGANIQQNTNNSIKTNELSTQIGAALSAIGSAANNSLESVHGISMDIEAINELVMQTNILSLNASVEAAHAGEQGKGFGVVAKEVGRLADQTKQAASTITETAQKSISETETSSGLLNDILPKIENAISLMKEITTASVEQNAGAAQVNTAISDLNTVTQQTASSAEEISSSSEELAKTAAQLNKMVGYFNI